MHMVAIGWLWVVFMMAITAGSVVSGILMFVLYGLAPCCLLFYWLIRQARRQRAQALWLEEQERLRAAAVQPPEAPAPGTGATD